MILYAHFDVVPAEDYAAWRHGPFSGAIEEGYLWGRGNQDIKVTLAAALGAAERLLGTGFRPRRGILFAFGGDEETGGSRGAGRIAALLASRGIHAAFLLDEGGTVVRELLPFADRPLALVGIAEKGYLDVILEARGAGGHAAMPPRRTVAGNLSRAIAALEASPSRLGFTTRRFLERLALFAPFGLRILFRNPAILGHAIKALFSVAPATDALVRTTRAVTILSGSLRGNVLADRATVKVNVRILPGEDSGGTLELMSRIVAPFGVTVSPAHPEGIVEPLPESPVDHEGWRAIESAVAAAFPDAASLPFPFSATTDTKHYRNLAGAIYRLTPLEMDAADLAGVHGRDERVAILNLWRCLRFHESLLTSQ